MVISAFMASTIGAGLTILVSGSRLLCAIEGDGTVPILRCLAVPPSRGFALFASGVVGELNAVAPFQTTFFLTCYTCVNASCAFLVQVIDPNWRPTFKYYHWAISVVSAVLCVWMMFAIDADVRVGCGRVLFSHLCPRGPQIPFGELRRWLFQGMKFQLSRNVLMKMDCRSSRATTTSSNFEGYQKLL